MKPYDECDQSTGDPTSGIYPEVRVCPILEFVFPTGLIIQINGCSLFMLFRPKRRQEYF
jgi:hypothetical protein